MFLKEKNISNKFYSRLVNLIQLSWLEEIKLEVNIHSTSHLLASTVDLDQQIYTNQTGGTIKMEYKKLYSGVSKRKIRKNKFL